MVAQRDIGVTASEILVIQQAYFRGGNIRITRELSAAALWVDMWPEPMPKFSNQDFIYKANIIATAIVDRAVCGDDSLTSAPSSNDHRRFAAPQEYRTMDFVRAALKCIGLAALLSYSGLSVAVSTPPIWRFGFFWSPANQSYPPSLIPWSNYTHVSQLVIMPTRSCGIDDESYYVKDSRAQFVSSAHTNGVKALISLLHDRDQTAIINCTRPANIGAFVATLVNYINQYNYDGLDLDWEAGVVPGQYQDLVGRLRANLPKKLLTADIAVHQRVYVVAIQNQLDRINLMNYDMGQSDYHGRGLRRAWHNAALRSVGDTTNYQSAEANLYYMISSGILASKINLGVPFYGYIFQGCTTSIARKFCPAGVKQPTDAFSGGGLQRTQIEYNKLLSSKYNLSPHLWDATRKAPYISYKGKSGACEKSPCDSDAFITYPDPQQMNEAVLLLLEKHLGGIMTFALHQEYMSGETGDKRYPLSTQIVKTLASKGRL